MYPHGTEKATQVLGHCQYSVGHFCFCRRDYKAPRKPNQEDLDPSQQRNCQKVIDALCSNWEIELSASAFTSTCHFSYLKETFCGRLVCFPSPYTNLSARLNGVLTGVDDIRRRALEPSLTDGLLWSVALSAVGFAQIIIHHRLYYLTMFCGAKTRIAAVVL